MERASGQKERWDTWDNKIGQKKGSAQDENIKEPKEATRDHAFLASALKYSTVLI